MASASEVTRYRPAVIALTSAAALYGIFVLYSTYSSQPAKSGLHRSNAVHRIRERSRPLTSEVEPHEPDGPLGGQIDSFADQDVFDLDQVEHDIAETEELNDVDGAPREPSQGLKGLLYYIAEEDAKRKAYEHRGSSCDECGETPIRGVRWHCLNCPDFDLCSTCEAQTMHQKTHVFVKIKIPLPVLSQPSKQYAPWYPGDPNKARSTLDSTVKKRLARETGFEEPGIEAFYDQFTTIANVSWSSDPSGVQAAIDRQAFNRALSSERWTTRFRPNALFDRMFAFYDTDSNGLVGFEEMVSGLAYLRGPKRFSSLTRALKGFDLDDDGYVDRQDFLRLFRAKYLIQRQLVSDAVEAHEAEQTTAAMDVLQSSLPISSVFNQEEIPQGEERISGGKQADVFGDMQPLPGTKTILDDSDPWPTEDQDAGLAGSAHARDWLQHHVSRFEEIMYGSAEDDGELSATHVPTSSSPNTAQAFDPPRPSIALHGSSNLSPVLDQDVLWQVVEKGFNEMLDSLFAKHETKCEEAMETHDERVMWRKDIARASEERRAFDEQLRSAAMVDPLIATLVDSSSNLKVERKPKNISEPPVRGGAVPTDDDSLAKREAAIAQTPLGELLNAAGYAIVEHHAESQAPSADTPTGAVTQAPPHDTSPTLGSSIPSDPTLPQNRPNTVNLPDPSATMQEQHHTDTDDAFYPATTPSTERLLYLATLEDTEAEMRERGGPGRLSYGEIEALVHSSPSQDELQGLVKNWLEWASF